MSLKTVPRAFVRSYFGGLRLPLSTIEKLSGQAQNKAWPPTLLFDSFESNAFQVVGGLLGDDELVEQGRLQAAKVSELRRAAQLAAKAEQSREQADAKLAQQRAAAAKDRQRAVQQADQREQQVERNSREAEAQLAQEVRAAEASLQDVEQQRERNVAAQERRTRLAAADAQARALAKEQAAIASAEKVVALDQKLEKKKQQRKSS